MLLNSKKFRQVFLLSESAEKLWKYQFLKGIWNLSRLDNKKKKIPPLTSNILKRKGEKNPEKNVEF